MADKTELSTKYKDRQAFLILVFLGKKTVCIIEIQLTKQAKGKNNEIKNGEHAKK